MSPPTSQRLSGGLRALLIDLSGTLHIDNQVTPRAPAAVAKLRERGVKILFCTNTTKEGSSELHQRLTRLGFTVHPDELFTSLDAARQLVERSGWNPLLFLAESARRGFPGVGESQTADGTAIPKDAVVIGLSPADFHYDKLNEAFRLLNQGAPLVAIHKARYFARPDGLALGPGGFVEALEYAAGVKATVVGKPERPFFQQALDRLEMQDCPCQVAMIGDDVEQDLGTGAIELGLQRILVRTGKYRPGDEDRAAVPLTAVCDNFAQAVDTILTNGEP
ncbi:Haloacid dehalogenase-like hydrolase domain-containing protein 2 [Tieghemiomyces parasiticus]|uniref:Haloacid dehalogenase-like hydrolase domain-containing protein 2 n=1 Tax=Tieghemiomyces parasiticus TaxID=78921 RepID=A0A9W8A2P6_9FUNG|nr:Haloacid dehalogenase-like hydrolase domain-containing protein 2 [Tieghemiomyces parasiticus]